MNRFALLSCILFIPSFIEAITARQAQAYTQEFQRVGIYDPANPEAYDEGRARFLLQELKKGFGTRVGELAQQMATSFKDAYRAERGNIQLLERQLEDQRAQAAQEIEARNDQIQEARRLLEEQTQATQTVRQLLDEQIRTSDAARRQLEQREEEHREQQATLQRQLSDQTRLNQELTAERGRQRVQIAQLEERNQQQDATLELLTREVTQAQEELAQQERSAQELIDQIQVEARTAQDRLSQDNQQLQQQLTEQQATAVQAQEELATAQQQLTTRNRIYQTLAREHEEQQASIERLKREATQAQQAAQEQLAQQEKAAQERIEQIEAEARTAQDRLTRDNQKLQQQLSEQQAVAAQTQQAADAQLQELQKQLEAAQQELKQAQASSTAEQTKLTQENQRLKEQLAEQTTSSQKRLQEQRAQLEAAAAETQQTADAQLQELKQAQAATSQPPALPPAPTADDRTQRVFSQRLTEFEQKNHDLLAQLKRAQQQLAASEEIRSGQERLIDELRERIPKKAKPQVEGKGKGKEEEDRTVDSSTYSSRLADARGAATLFAKQSIEGTLVKHPLFFALDLDSGTPREIKFGAKRFKINNPNNPALTKLDESQLLDAPTGPTKEGASMSEEQKQRALLHEQERQDTTLNLSRSLSPEQFQYILGIAKETDVKEEGSCGDEFRKNGTIAIFATHGTWSNKAAFGGDLFTISTYNIFKFACQLAAAKKMRVKVFSVSWTGALSIEDRKVKAAQLAKYCKTLWDTPNANIKETWMIAHSHGCNVSAMAANQLYKEEERLVDVAIFMASPALDVPAPLDFKTVYAFYAQGDFTQAIGSAQGRYNLQRKLPWAKPRSGRKVYNIRVMLNGYDMDHVSIKWGVLPHLAKILTYIDTYYPTYFDLEMNVEDHPNSLPLIAIRHKEQNIATDGNALAEDTRVREAFERKYKRDISQLGIKYFSGVTWLLNLAREGVSAWKGEPEIGAEFLTELPSDSASSSSTSSRASSSSAAP